MRKATKSKSQVTLVQGVTQDELTAALNSQAEKLKKEFSNITVKKEAKKSMLTTPLNMLITAIFGAVISWTGPKILEQYNKISNPKYPLTIHGKVMTECNDCSVNELYIAAENTSYRTVPNADGTFDLIVDVRRNDRIVKLTWSGDKFDVGRTDVPIPINGEQFVRQDILTYYTGYREDELREERLSQINN